MRLFEVEDRAVAWFDVNHAIVFSHGEWRETSISFARKTRLDGYEMSPDEFARTYPLAWRLLAARQSAASGELAKGPLQGDQASTGASVELEEIEASDILRNRVRRYLDSAEARQSGDRQRAISQSKGNLNEAVDRAVHRIVDGLRRGYRD